MWAMATKSCLYPEDETDRITEKERATATVECVCEKWRVYVSESEVFLCAVMQKSYKQI